MKKKITKISKWTGLFSVNGLGLNFCGIFEEKANYFGKKRREKSSEVSVKFENLEEMSKWTRLFQSRLTNKQTKKLKTKELEEKKFIVRFSGKKEGKNSEKIGKNRRFRKKSVNGLGFFSKCPGLF